MAAKPNQVAITDGRNLSLAAGSDWPIDPEHAEIYGNDLAPEDARWLRDQVHEMMLDIAPTSMVRQWLAALGLLTAGKMDASDAEAKLSAYAPILDYPKYCYTPHTLKRAGRKFQWFPAFHELCEFLDEEKRKVAAIRSRCARSVGYGDDVPRSRPRSLTNASIEESLAHTAHAMRMPNFEAQEPDELQRQADQFSREDRGKFWEEQMAKTGKPG